VLLARCLLVCLLATAFRSLPAEGQQKAPSTAPSLAAIPTARVKMSPDTDLSMALPDKALVLSTQCDSDGNPYVEILSLAAPWRQVIAFKNKSVVTFAMNQMTDTPDPHMGPVFVTDSQIYAIVSGTENAKKEEVISHDEAGKEIKYSRTIGDPRHYIARFDSDGTYRGALKLDAGFKPIQIAAFGSGDFAVGGVDENDTPRVAVLNSRGGFVEYLELPKDISDRPKSTAKAFDQAMGASADSPAVIAMFASFRSYNGNVLLVRSGSVAPVYEIRETGAARAVKIKSPGNLSISKLIPSNQSWFIDFRGPLGDDAEAIYEVNPETGELLRQYRMEDGSGAKVELSCVINGNFIGFRHQEGKLTVLKGTVGAGN
jgi:hypothetical protein